MSKKVVIILCLVLVFFLGCIWLDNVPVVGSLVAFIEAVAGFAAGYLFCKEVFKPQLVSSQSAIQTLKEEILTLRETLRQAVSSETPKTRRKKKAEVVEEPKGE